MINKIPVPINLFKSTLGLRNDIEIIKATISDNVLYLYTVTEGEHAANLTTKSENEPMQFSVVINEAS